MFIAAGQAATVAIEGENEGMHSGLVSMESQNRGENRRASSSSIRTASLRTPADGRAIV
jgi:hypothetical protein